VGDATDVIIRPDLTLRSLEDRIRQVAIEVAPGSKPCRIRKLAGGVLTTVHAFDLDSEGEVLRLVLRRYRPGNEWRNMMLGMLRTLTVLEAERIPAPRALWSDPDGASFGVPAVVLTRLRGRPSAWPPDPVSWARQLGAVLAQTHSMSTKKYDLSYLPAAFEVAPALLDRAFAPTAEMAAHPLASTVLTGLRQFGTTLDLQGPVFAHGDFWPGQVIWWRGQLQGVVDWDFPRLDDPGIDVGYCRLDIAIMTNRGVADEFLAAYETACGHSLRNVRFWDLLAAFQAMEHPGSWHRQGFRGIGRPDLYGVLLERKLAHFVGVV